MSLFKKTRWKAYAATIPLIPEEDDFPNMYLSQIIGGAMHGGSLAGRLTMANIMGLPGQVRSMTYYARRSFVHGTPESSHRYYDEADELDYSDTDDAVLTLLDEAEPPEVGHEVGWKSEFLPVAILMHDQVPYNKDPDSPLAKTTDRLLSKLHLEGADILEEFENEEMKKIQKWDFYLNFGIPMRTKVEGSKRYLFELFTQIGKHSKFSKEDFFKYIENRNDGKAQPIEELAISEGDISGYNVEYRWSFIDTQTMPFAGKGDAPKKGKTNIEFHKRSTATNTLWKETMAALYPTMGVVKRRNRPRAHDTIIIWRHNHDGSMQRLVMVGLSMQYVINTREIDNSNSNPRLRTSEPNLFGDEEEQDEFVIPVSIGALQNLTPMQQEETLANGLQATAFLVQKIKSYRGWFGWLVIIITLIIAFFTFQYQLIPAAAIAVAGTSAMMYAVLVVVFSIMFSMLVSFAGSMISSEWGQIAFMVAMIYLSMGGWEGIKQGMQNMGSSIRNAWTNVTMNPGVMTAFNFLKAVNPFLQIGFSYYERSVLADLERDYERLEEDQRDAIEAIEAANSGLDTPSWLDPLDIVTTPHGMGFFEMPDNFFARVLNSNPGVLGLEFPEIFLEGAVSLPKNLNDGNMTMQQFYELANMRV